MNLIKLLSILIHFTSAAMQDEQVRCYASNDNFAPALKEF